MPTLTRPPAVADPQESLLGALAWLPLLLLVIPPLYVVGAVVGIVRGLQDLLRGGGR